MSNSAIEFDELRLNSFPVWGDQWFLLTAGSFAEKKYNCMTIAWGSLGIMWEKPFVQVVVRPTRYTNEFMQAYPDFTVCGFPPANHKALQYLGSKSGRNEDKIAKTGLTPCGAEKVGSPAFAEANLIFECRKIYADVFRPESFIDPAIAKQYPAKDYHLIYYGQILAVRGDREVYC